MQKSTKTWQVKFQDNSFHCCYKATASEIKQRNSECTLPRNLQVIKLVSSADKCLVNKSAFIISICQIFAVSLVIAIALFLRC